MYNRTFAHHDIGLKSLSASMNPLNQTNVYKQSDWLYLCLCSCFALLHITLAVLLLQPGTLVWNMLSTESIFRPASAVVVKMCWSTPLPSAEYLVSALLVSTNTCWSAFSRGVSLSARRYVKLDMISRALSLK